MRRALWVACLGLLLLGTARCQGEKAHPPFVSTTQIHAPPPANDAGLIIPDGAPEADWMCGDELIQTMTDPPNIYFVVDRSGSMQEPMPGSAQTKLASARIAISGLLHAMGHRIHYGAAVFPIPNTTDSCVPGHQIFPTTAGDAPAYAANNQTGPILQDLLTRLRNQEPGSGATPTAATLLALIPTLQALPGKTYVVLMTDGAPNCGDDFDCSVDRCMSNIEQVPGCTPSFNCCDPAVVGNRPLGTCVDHDATVAAVTRLAAQGIDTYVVGMPGAEPYANLLSELATAGGTARPGPTAYYAVDDDDALTSALRGIGSQLAISCDIQLAQPPDSQNLVNIVFDGRVVPENPDGADSGWSWTGPQSLALRGSSCDELLSGNVYEVLVLAGCDTVLR